MGACFGQERGIAGSAFFFADENLLFVLSWPVYDHPVGCLKMKKRPVSFIRVFRATEPAVFPFRTQRLRRFPSGIMPQRNLNDQ
jgi:hypothetical protein